jgi:hypothetical protein
MTYLELINSVSGLLGWTSMDAITDTANSEQTKVVRCLNSILKAMQTEQDWSELRAQYRLSVEAVTTEAEQFTITKGNSSGACTSPATNFLLSTDVGKALKAGTHKAIYYVTDVSPDDDRFVTLDRVWTGPSLAEQQYWMGWLSYSMPSDYDRILSGSAITMDSGLEITEISPTEMRKVMKDAGGAFRVGDPKHFCVHGLDSSGNPKIHFDSVFEVARSLEFEYQKKHPTIATGAGASNDPILYPERFNLYIIDQAVAKLSRDVEQSATLQANFSDVIKEANRANSSPSPTRERTVVKPVSLRHGAFRRR